MTSRPLSIFLIASLFIHSALLLSFNAVDWLSFSSSSSSSSIQARLQSNKPDETNTAKEEIPVKTNETEKAEEDEDVVEVEPKVDDTQTNDNQPVADKLQDTPTAKNLAPEILTTVRSSSLTAEQHALTQSPNKQPAKESEQKPSTHKSQPPIPQLNEKLEKSPPQPTIDVATSQITTSDDEVSDTASVDASGSDNDDEQQEQQVVSLVSSDFKQYFHYPRLAKRRGWQGEVVVSFIMENGKPVQIELEQSSGYRLLDESAINSLKKVRLSPTLSYSTRINYKINYVLQ